MTEATVNLREYGAIAAGRVDPRTRTGILMMLGVGAGVTAIATLLLIGGIELRPLAIRLIADAIVLLALVAYISLSTRSAVTQLRTEIVEAIVGQVSAVVANRVSLKLEDVGETQTSEMAALTRELVRMRGQMNTAFGNMGEAVQRVEALVKSDIAVAYDLGAQSARD